VWGKRIVFGFVVVLILMLPSTAALAAPAAGNGRNATSPGHRKTASTSSQPDTPNNTRSHAGQNASRGMNRPGSAGHWKSHGHSPAAVSFPQGHSPSDPDFNGNGGLDKPGQTGGFSSDRDGNNGCGNDNDREDDNNGWCGLKPHKVSPPPVGPPVTPPVTPPGKGPKVLPIPKITRVEHEKLANTGIDAFDLSYAGIALMIAGQFLRKRARKGSR